MKTLKLIFAHRSVPDSVWLLTGQTDSVMFSLIQRRVHLARLRNRFNVLQLLDLCYPGCMR